MTACQLWQVHCHKCVPPETLRALVVSAPMLAHPLHSTCRVLFIHALPVLVMYTSGGHSRRTSKGGSKPLLFIIRRGGWKTSKYGAALIGHKRVVTMLGHHSTNGLLGFIGTWRSGDREGCRINKLQLVAAIKNLIFPIAIGIIVSENL